MTDSRDALHDVLVRYPYWPHAPRGSTPEQVATFAVASLAGGSVHGWPDDAAPRAFAVVHETPWDSQKLGVRAARLSLIVPPDAADGAAPLLAGVIAAADADGVGYVVARLDAGDVHSTQVLERQGFVLVDAILSQYLAVGGAPPAPPSGAVAVRTAQAADAARLEELSDECFTMSRFHWDPWIGIARARAIYREWARNIASGQDDVDLVAELDGTIVGFLSCKDVPGMRAAYGFGQGRIGLVAVAAAARGRGVVGAMTSELVARAPSFGWDLLGIGTQIANVRAIRAYQRTGFAPGDSIVTLRRRPGDRALR